MFFAELWQGVGAVWPILSGLIGVMVLLGAVIGWREGWSIGDSIYFAFVSGLTIGYGDLVPKHPLSRTLAVCTGFTGILLTGLVDALAERAMERSSK